MSDINFNTQENVEKPLTIDFSKIIVPEQRAYEIPTEIATTQGGNVFANTPAAAKPSSIELQRIVQKLDKLEKMINPNSKKSLILWEEDNSFKSLISMITSYANTCDTKEEFPIELFDKLKALGTDVNNQITEGTTKVAELEEQQKLNTHLAELLSNAYIAATAGLPAEQYESYVTVPELEEYRDYLEQVATNSPASDEYINAEKYIKSKITNLENSVHITIDLERTTSKAGALEYIKKEVTPSIERLQAAYDAQYRTNAATEIDGEEAITDLAVKKSISERIYDTFVRPFTNLFRRKNKVR